MFDDITQLSTQNEWFGIKKFGVVQADRTIKINTTRDLRFYITNKPMTAGQMLLSTRAHLEVKNNLHWMLDVGCWMLDVGCWMLDVGCVIQ